MPASLSGRLVVAISSRALFDFEAENQVFEAGDDHAYMALQQQRLDEPAPPGVAFSLVQKLLAFNAGGPPQVEVVVLSRNDPISGLRVFRSARHYGLAIERGVFTRGASPWRHEYARGFHHAQSKLQFATKYRSRDEAQRLRRWLLMTTTLGLPLRAIVFSPKLLARMFGRWRGLVGWRARG